MKVSYFSFSSQRLVYCYVWCSPSAPLQRKPRIYHENFESSIWKESSPELPDLLGSWKTPDLPTPCLFSGVPSLVASLAHSWDSLKLKEWFHTARCWSKLSFDGRNSDKKVRQYVCIIRGKKREWDYWSRPILSEHRYFHRRDLCIHASFLVSPRAKRLLSQEFDHTLSRQELMTLCINLLIRNSATETNGKTEVSVQLSWNVPFVQAVDCIAFTKEVDNLWKYVRT